MLLPREFVSYLSRQIVRRLTPGTVETHSPDKVAELVGSIITEELNAEDKLNDEVRDLLEQYSDYMRKEGVSYQDMFRKIKNTMVQQRKIVRASGRDTGDQMKLSRDKITDISHKLIGAIRKSRRRDEALMMVVAERDQMRNPSPLRRRSASKGRHISQKRQ